MKRATLLLYCILGFSFSLLADITFPIPCMQGGIKSTNPHTTFFGSEHSCETGRPQLPVLSYTFLIPPDADLNSISLSINGLQEEQIDGKHTVVPVPPLSSIDGPVWPQKRHIVDGKDVALYSKNAFFPNTYYEIIDCGTMNCFKLVQVRIYLYKYNPVAKRLKRLTKGELKLNFQSCKEYTVTGNASYRIPTSLKKVVRALAVNYSDIVSRYDTDYTFTTKEKYVVITTSAIQSSSQELNNLLESKKKRGFETEVITESVWGGGVGVTAAKRLRKWLQDNYKTMGIRYILLLGNGIPTSGDVPMKTEGSYPTDYYFAQLDDPFRENKADVSVGRIPIYNNDVAPADKIMKRIIAYENTAKEDALWRLKALLITEPYTETTPGSDLFELVKSRFLEPNGWKHFRIYDDNFGNPDVTECTQAAVKEAWIDKPYGLVEWMTHGQPTFADSIMYSETTPLLGDTYPSIVFMGSCLNSKIEVENNLAYEMLKNQSIATIGGTRVTWFMSGTTVFEGQSTTQGFVFHFCEGISKESLSAGDAFYYMKARVPIAMCWANYTSYNLYGCPEVGVFSFNNNTRNTDDAKSVVAGSQMSLFATPNPGDKTSTIRFHLHDNEFIQGDLTVYSAKGTIITKIPLTPKAQTQTWDLQNNQGQQIAGGSYVALATLKYKDGTVQQKKVMVRIQ